MDGLLLDTERIALDTFLDACRRCHFEPDIKVYMKCIGTKNEKTKEILTEGHGLDFPYDEIKKVWSKSYKKATTENPVPVKSGVKDILNFLQQLNIKIAIATSTRYETAVNRLQNAEIYHFFEMIVGGDQVDKGKPDPEIYLTVSGLLKEDPKECVVFEDSDNGVLSAHKAGMDVIQIPDLKEPAGEMLNLGHRILSSLGEARLFLMNSSAFS